jgi:hypothetical protein
VSLGKEAKNYLAASLTNGQAYYFRHPHAGDSFALFS